MSFALVAAAAVLAVLTVGLVAPMSVEVSAAKGAGDEIVHARVRVRWLGITMPGWRATRADSAPRRTRTRTLRAKARTWNARAMLQSPGFVSRCVRLAADLIRLVRPHRLRCHGRVGFEDPADTGMFLGWLYVTLALPASGPGWSVRVEPDFTDEVIEGELRALWRRSLGTMLWPVLMFTLSPTVWRGVRRGWR